MTETNAPGNPGNPVPGKNPETPATDPQLLQVMQEIRDELRLFNRNFSRLIAPEVVLNHYTRGASLRVDDSHSPTSNPTF